jgi:hypothetical protein
MIDIKKYKQQILISLTALIVLGLLAVFFVIGAAQSFKGNGAVLVLIGIFLVQIPIIINMGMVGIKILNYQLKEQKIKAGSKIEEAEKLDQEVEEKVKEADDLAFNLKVLDEKLGTEKEWEAFGQKLLSGISEQIEIVVGVLFKKMDAEDKYTVTATYAYFSELPPSDFQAGEGIAGQAIKNGKAMFLTEIPEGYVKVVSGLGDNEPKNLAFLPIKKGNNTIGLLEIATFKPFNESFKRRAEEIGNFIGEKTPDL